MTTKVQKTKNEWQKQLTPEQYHITREKGTERPFTGEYYHNKEEGVYRCVCCGTELFSSDTKYESGSGWLAQLLGPHYQRKRGNGGRSQPLYAPHRSVV